MRPIVVRPVQIAVDDAAVAAIVISRLPQIFYLIQVISLMVVVKKQELLHKARARAKADTAAAANGNSKKEQ
jgi:hypothetical protein